MFAAPLQVCCTYSICSVPYVSIGRGKEGTILYEVEKETKTGNITMKKVKDIADESCEKYLYSRFGQEMILVFKSHVLVTSESEEKKKIEQADVLEVAFSPKCTYFVLLSKYANENTKNLFVYANTSEPEVLLERVYKPGDDERWPLFQWCESEKVCVMVTHKQEVEFFSKKMKVSQTFRRRKVRQANLSPSGKYIAVSYYDDHKKSEACSIYDVKKTKKPIVTTLLRKCDEEKIVWNNCSTGVLIHMMNQIDETNESYYGTSELMVFKRDWLKRQGIVIAKEVLDFKWNYSGTKFIVTHSSPPQAEVYSHEGKLVHKFSEGSRDKILFSKGGNSICALCGSGSFNGVLEFWDLVSKKKVGKGESDYPSNFEFSPDSNYLMTSTVTPVLYDSNKIQIWDIKGEMKYEMKFDTLYQAQFYPRDPKIYPRSKKGKFKEYVEEKKEDDVYVPPFLKSGGVVGGSGVKSGAKNNSRSEDGYGYGGRSRGRGGRRGRRGGRGGRGRGGYGYGGGYDSYNSNYF